MDPAAPRRPSPNRSPSRWRRARRLGLGAALLACAGVNGLAYLHARSMTTFVPAGASTAAPEALRGGGRLLALVGGVKVRRPENRVTPSALGLEYQTHRLEGSGPVLELWELEPDGPAAGVALVCHGYAASKDSLLPTGDELRRQGFRTLLLDFRGSGGSGGNQTSLGYREADDVARGAEFARSRVPAGAPLVLFGTSMGAAACLRAIHLGQVAPEGLILESPFDRLLTTVRARFDLLGVPSWPGAELLVFWGGQRLGIDGFAHAPLDYARAVECPSLVMHGELDRRVSVAQARSVWSALATTERSFYVFSGLGHEPFLRAQPEAWRRAVAELLARVSGRAAPTASPQRGG